jgi:ribonuclease D
MQPEDLAAPIWVDRPAVLCRVVAEISNEPLLAVDTESNSLYAYQEQVCLIQVSSPRVDYLIDPLAISDLSPLGPLFSTPATEPIFHASEYDLICLTRDFAFQFSNLFDTMLAARILGRKAFGLGSLIESEFGISLDKHYQRANWGQRPLRPAMLAYARLDSHYLIPLRTKLKAELEEVGLWELAQEDFRRIRQVKLPVEAIPAEACGRISGSQDLTPTQAAILQSLCAYRDRQARYANLPTFKVLANEALLAIAQTNPVNMEDLAGLPGLSTKLVMRHATGLLQAVERGRHAPPLSRPRPPRRNDALLNRLDWLRTWRKEAGAKMKVESDVILPRDVMDAIAEVNPRNLEQLAKVMVDLPWRLEHFGVQILKALKH